MSYVVWLLSKKMVRSGDVGQGRCTVEVVININGWDIEDPSRVVQEIGLIAHLAHAVEAP